MYEFELNGTVVKSNDAEVKNVQTDITAEQTVLKDAEPATATWADNAVKYGFFILLVFSFCVFLIALGNLIQKLCASRLRTRYFEDIKKMFSAIVYKKNANKQVEINEQTIKDSEKLLEGLLDRLENVVMEKK